MGTPIVTHSQARKPSAPRDVGWAGVVLKCRYELRWICELSRYRCDPMTNPQRHCHAWTSTETGLRKFPAIHNRKRKEQILSQTKLKFACPDSRFVELRNRISERADQSCCVSRYTQ